MSTKLTIAACVVLYKVVVHILYDENGNERDLPFNLKYKLQRCSAMIEKDVNHFEKVRIANVEKFGTKQEDGSIQVKDDQMEAFQNEMKTVLAQETEAHEFSKLTPSEVDLITVNGVSNEEIALFTACLVEDPELNLAQSPENTDDGEVAQEAPATNN